VDDDRIIEQGYMLGVMYANGTGVPKDGLILPVAPLTLAAR
jgi:TPR repeat protein